MKHLIAFLVLVILGATALSLVPPGTHCDCGGKCNCRKRCFCGPTKRCSEPSCDCLSLPSCCGKGE